MFMEYVIPAFLMTIKRVSWLEPKWLKRQINPKI
jgi:hypothetical protein